MGGGVGLVRRCGFRRAGAVAHRLANLDEICDGDQTAGAVQRVAGLVPLLVVFAADDVQEIAGGEAQKASVGGSVGGAGVVVEGFYDLGRGGVSERSLRDKRIRVGAWAGRAWAWAWFGLGSVEGRLTFLGGTMAMASLGGMEMWCGRESLSPFTDLRTNWSTLALVTA